MVDFIAQLDPSEVYAGYAPVGGEAIAPEILLGLLFYGYETGTFSSRKIEKATYESIPMRFIDGGLHPDHGTIAHFRKQFLEAIKGLFIQILLLAQAAGVLQMGNVSLDGSKIHADVSKSHAVSYQGLIELEAQLKQEVNELFELGERADPGEIRVPEGMVIVAHALSNHPNDIQEAAPTLDALPPGLGKPEAVARTTATSVNRPSRRVSSGGSIHTLPLGAKRIIWIGTPFSSNSQTNRPRIPVRK